MRRLAIPLGLAGLAAAVTFAVVHSVGWLGTPHPGRGTAVEISWPADPAEGVQRLRAAGVIDREGLFRVLLIVTRPFVSPAPGPHLLADNLTPAEVLRRLSRLASRQRARLVVPEGYNRYQVGERLESLGVASRRAFAEAATNPALLDQLGVAGGTAEGYLFPATYDVFLDSEARSVVSELVSEAKKRLAALRASNAAGFARVTEKYGWGERELLTLASVVEKEAARADEMPVIASVFYNRLDSSDFRPARSLQSDPTAAYGCLVQPELDSCRGGTGVTPAMLRDPANTYNTYRHAGLPPSPIANPGLAALGAVLEPAGTDFLFFVATGDGRHTFSRTLSDHEAAIRKGR